MQPFAWLWELRYVDSQNERTQGGGVDNGKVGREQENGTETKPFSQT